MKRQVVLGMTAIVFLAVVLTATVPKPDDQITVTVHEWGTFTSIAGEQGEPMVWRTYGGSSDLPCFVNSFGGFKGGLLGNVRMETPVLYFYGPRDFAANVKVRFPQGKITEWYPSGIMDRAYDSIDWRNIRVMPNGSPEFPAESGASHYYAARQTSAAPLAVGSQVEKFLFYRGVGTFPLPISATTFAGGKLVLKNTGVEPINGVVLFENRAGRIRYQVVGALKGDAVLSVARSRNDLPGLLVELEIVLVDQGLFPEEAKAMINTWRDSWFEEGMRVFYIVPRVRVDSILPLDITPAPAQVTRVFVGRMEIVTDAIQDDVRRAIANNDLAALRKYGRFLEPIARRMGLKSRLLDSVYAEGAGNGSPCRR